MWHVSVSGSPFGETLKETAIANLGSVGAKELGEWHEPTMTVYHVRRRLSAREEKLVGQAIDIRGTAEADERIKKLIIAYELSGRSLTPSHRKLIEEESGSN